MELQWSQKTIEDLLLTEETAGRADESIAPPAAVVPHHHHHPSFPSTNNKEKEQEVVLVHNNKEDGDGRAGRADPRLFCAPSNKKSSDAVLVAQKPLIIVGMSANSDSESKRLAQEAGMDYFLEKPFSMSDFNELLLRIHFSQHPDEFLSSADDETLSILDSPPGTIESPLTVLHRQESSSLRFGLMATPALSPELSPPQTTLSPAPKMSTGVAGASSATINLVRKAKRGAAHAEAF